MWPVDTGRILYDSAMIQPTFCFIDPCCWVPVGGPYGDFRELLLLLFFIACLITRRADISTVSLSKTIRRLIVGIY